MVKYLLSFMQRQMVKVSFTLFGTLKRLDKNCFEQKDTIFIFYINKQIT